MRSPAEAALTCLFLSRGCRGLSFSRPLQNPESCLHATRPFPPGFEVLPELSEASKFTSEVLFFLMFAAGVLWHAKPFIQAYRGVERAKILSAVLMARRLFVSVVILQTLVSESTGREERVNQRV